MKKPAARNVVEKLTPTEMAAVLRVSELELSNLTKEGALRRTSEMRDGRPRIAYAWRQTVGDYIAHLKAPGEEARREFLLEKSATQRITRARAELELAKARGELVDRRYVLAVMADLLTVVKNHILAVPSRVSRLVLGMTNFQQVHEVLKRDHELVLREVSEFDVGRLVPGGGGLNGGTNGNRKQKRRPLRRKRAA